MAQAADRINVLQRHIVCGLHEASQGSCTQLPVSGRYEGKSLPTTWRARPDAAISDTRYTLVLQSKLDPTEATFQQRYKHNTKLCEEITAAFAVASVGGGGKYEALTRQRGKFLPRERVKQIIDEGTEFMELSPLGAWKLFGGDWHSGGIITGIGLVAGRECMFICNDQTIKGGTYSNPAGGQKNARAQAISLQNHLPCLYIVDGGGAKLDSQAKPQKKGAQAKAPKRDLSFEGVLPAMFTSGGAMFAHQCKTSALGIPQVAVTCGGATAGSAYFVALCEEGVIVNQNGSVYLGGPPLVKAATGEDADNESLGGAWMHTTTSGTTDHYAPDEASALAMARRIVENMGRQHPRVVLPNLAVPEPPAYDVDSILGVIPEDNSTPYDFRELLARIVDGSRFHEFRALYGKTLVCGWAHLEGYPVGILGNNGLISSDAAMKAGHFIQMCNMRKTPLIFFHNTRGFEKGSGAEQAGIVRNSAKMILAMANATVPKFSVICGDSFGPGHYAMCGRAFGPRFLFTWPSARIAGMSSQELAESTVQFEEELREEEGKPALTEDEVTTIKNDVMTRFESQITAWQSTGWVCDDGLLDPRDTRRILANSISISLNAPWPSSDNGFVFR